MARIAFYHEIKEGKQEEYRRLHEDIPEYLERAYLESDAGLERFSLFEKDGFVFGYMEVDNPERIKTAMSESDAQKQWQEKTLPLLKELPDDFWMDEVYRLR